MQRLPATISVILFLSQQYERFFIVKMLVGHFYYEIA